MTFKPRTWFPIASVLSVANLIGVAFATPPPHAAVHAGLALAFGLWAQRLYRRKSENPTPVETRLDTPLEQFEAELHHLRQELNETQERLDFAERMLAQGQQTRRVDEPR
ncbi:MAG TPA: hypothetical protein VIG08_11265 [Gemmatimonadales bacterium]|jgi:hypothetical protein